MVQSIQSFIVFFKDCLKTYLIDLVMLFGSLCIIYQCDKLAVSVIFAIFSLYLLPLRALLLVVIHRFMLSRARIRLSIGIILGSFSIWLVTYFVAFLYFDSFLRQISYRLFDGIEFKFKNVLVGDVYTVIADLVMIFMILSLYYFKTHFLNKRTHLISK